MLLLPPLHSDQYYINASSLPSMRNVLVLTMPNTRNYTVNTDVKSNNTVRVFSNYPSPLFVVVLLCTTRIPKRLEHVCKNVKKNRMQ